MATTKQQQQQQNELIFIIILCGTLVSCCFLEGQIKIGNINGNTFKNFLLKVIQSDCLNFVTNLIKN